MFDFLWQYVGYWASVEPEFPSLRCQQNFSARQFNDMTDRLARIFLNFGVKKGDRIVTILPSCWEYVFTLIAANKIGAIVAPMDVRYRLSELRNFITHVEPKIIVSTTTANDNDILGSLQQLNQEFNDITYFFTGTADFGYHFNDVLKIEVGLEEELRRAKLDQDLDDGALIIFTGGTTGVPKAALLSQRNVSFMCIYEQDVFKKHLESKGITGRTKTLAALPPSHVGGTLELIGTGIVGGYEMILMEQWSPRSVLKITQEERIPLIGGVPTMYAIMLTLPELDQYDLSSLQVALLSGEKVSLELLHGIKTRICDNIIVGYGSTEAGSEVTFTEINDSLEDLKEGYVGKPLPNVDIRIIDDNENPVPALQIGEVIVKGPLTSKNYFKMPEEDKCGFTADGYCKTGDLGYLTEDGGLFIKGRKKHIIRVGSYTVLPSEVEEVVLKSPDVAIAAAIGVPDKIYGEVIWLVVTPESNKSINEKDMIRICELELASYKVPKRVLIRANIPTTRIGKADRELLKKEVLENHFN